MANNDYITTDCKLTVSKNTAKLDEEIFLYKNDRNIKLLIEIVDNKYRYKSDDLSNLLVKYKASYAQVKWYKNAEVKKEFPIQATDDGKVVFVIEGQLIDEDTELGDYDLQLRLLNESQESIRSLPIIKGAVHILKPLFEEGDIATVNSAVADVSMLSLDGDAIDTYNSDGTYNQTNWGNGDVISSAKLNKLEKVAKDNVDKVNKMPAKSIVEGGKIYLTKEDGTKLDSGTELPVGGSTIEVVNNLESDSTTAALSAAQGKALNTQYKDIAKKIEGGNLGNSVEPQDYDIPKVFLTGDNFSNMTTSKNEVTMDMEYISKTDRFTSAIKIKFQGDSSLTYPKKNFTIKMYEDDTYQKKLKKEFKNWGTNQNKYVLKANYIDITHARNIVSARLWSQIVKSRSNYDNLNELLKTSPNQGAIDGFLIKLYVNGTYQGRYTWNISKDAYMANMDSNLENNAILGSNDYNSGCFRSSSCTWEDEVHDTIPQSILTSFNNVLNFVMTSSNEEFVTNFSNYLDKESIIDYYIFNYVNCGLDAFGKNQLMFTYDGIHWIASVYDMDSTWGLYFNGQSFVSPQYRCQEDYQSCVVGQGNLLYMRLVENFYRDVQTRYFELRKDILSINNIINEFERFTDLSSAELTKEDYTIYNGIPNAVTNNIQQIRKYAKDRLAYVDEQILNLTPIKVKGVKITNTEKSINIGKKLQITYSIIPSNSTNKIVSFSSSNNNIATIDNDGIISAIKEGEFTITITTNDGNFTDNITLSVINNIIEIQSMSLDNSSLNLFVNDTKQLNLTYTPENTTQKSVTWNSSNDLVATVSKTGLVTAVGTGECIITATSTFNSSISQSCSIVSKIDDNILRNVSFTKSALNTDTGEVNPNGSDYTSELIELEENSYYEFKLGMNCWLNMVCYDSSGLRKATLSKMGQSNTYCKRIYTSNEVKFIRISVNNAQYSNMKLKKLEVNTDGNLLLGNKDINKSEFTTYPIPTKPGNYTLTTDNNWGNIDSYDMYGDKITTLKNLGATSGAITVTIDSTIPFIVVHFAGSDMDDNDSLIYSEN